ncbi:MAG: hypothetical protein HFE64_07025 [Lachnospiraceae bacterium]|nr:hypothetical protein [Lachnospiraceae bacterium]
MSVRIMSLKLNRLLMYAGIALAVLIALVILLTKLLGGSSSGSASADTEYYPGTYTTSVPLGTGCITVQMTFSETGIEAVSYDIPDTVQSVYPLVQPTAASIGQQLTEGTQMEALQIDSASSETAAHLLKAMKLTVDKATVQ